MLIKYRYKFYQKQLYIFKNNKIYETSHFDCQNNLRKGVKIRKRIKYKNFGH